MRLERVRNYREGSQRGAELFASLSKLSPSTPVGLATGATMWGIYSELAQSSFRPDFQDVFLLDEYLGLQENSPGTFEHEIRTRFCEPLDFKGRVHVPHRGRYAGKDGALNFEDELLSRGPLSVQLLGLGTNGHIAFNEPGSAPDSLTRIVVLAEQTRKANARHFPERVDVPTHAVTQGLATIRRASSLVLLVFGASKQRALVNGLTLDKPVHPLNALLEHPNLTIITDIDLPELPDWE